MTREEQRIVSTHKENGMKTTYDLNNELVRHWDVYRQQWRELPPRCIDDHVVAALSTDERVGIIALCDDFDFERVSALRDEAGQSGDLKQVALCDAALAGDVAALGRCVEVMQ
jgi:hypothetical protein